ncbi:hypothetical protein, partial [Klebsiella pneumoniae]|uniref:hypothetical protein n=3 Tax=Klebsiella pneumoniae TaxID=573 RepID=UPI001C13133F
GGKNSLNRLIRCVCGKKIGPDPRNFNQRVSLGRNDLLIRTFPELLKAHRRLNIPTKNQMSKEMSGQCRMISTSETRHAPEQRRTTHRHSREPAQRSDALRPRN